MKRATIGVFGGSGFYRFLKKYVELTVDTPYGLPSAPLRLSTIGGRKVAFLPRHGDHHEFPPHALPYRANLAAFKEVGVERIIGPCAVGSLSPNLRPGDFVICDQFVNYTTGRRDTFYDGPETTHISSADPYCPELRELARDAAKRLKLPFHYGGTVVVIQGPRFSTRAESRFFRKQGWDVINMTQYPEAVLARELEMCYANISLVTDYDSGLEGDPKVKPVSHGAVIKIFNENIENLRALITEMIEAMPETRSCSCGTALEHARLKA
ncbi:MAG: S-methyl-5'-thioadenosine phosphorylase [Thaumarchaeota archaeon]|nr:S-methyl-5'-thioadenosine phosphorylase [Nitrososphaerota archaeon]